MPTSSNPTSIRPETAAGTDEPAFAAPWEAQVFALKAHLVEAGHIRAGDFARLFGEALREPHQAADEGTAYFVAFVAALERAVAGLAPPAELAEEREAWQEAAAHTPHGEPIALKRHR